MPISIILFPFELTVTNFQVDDDIDGIPLEKFSANSLKPGGFIPSKWETVDPDQIEAQAITTSKWDTLDPVAPEPPSLSEISNDGSYDTEQADFAEEKRTRLREIEVKIMQYQDELESGHRTLKPGWTMNQQVEHYRRKLMKKSDKDMSLAASTSAADQDSPDKYGRKEVKRSLSPSEVP